MNGKIGKWNPWLGPRPRRPRESDVRGLLAQQMVHWGLDARHPGGNLFVRTGFGRMGRPAEGTSSIYRLERAGGGSIELHGTYVRWVAEGRAHVFLRGSRRLGVVEAFDPACPDGAELTAIAAGALENAVRPLLAWVSDHEQWVLARCGSRWRELGWKKLRSLPLGPAWAAPEQTREWLLGVVAAARRGKPGVALGSGISGASAGTRRGARFNPPDCRALSGTGHRRRGDGQGRR